MACGGLNPLFAPHMDPGGFRGLGYSPFALGPFGSHSLPPHHMMGALGSGVFGASFGGPGVHHSSHSATSQPLTSASLAAAAGEANQDKQTQPQARMAWGIHGGSKRTTSQLPCRQPPLKRP
jgi:hypothetical protein